jgi:hypothetical protein
MTLTLLEHVSTLFIMEPPQSLNQYGVQAVLFNLSKLSSNCNDQLPGAPTGVVKMLTEDETAAADTASTATGGVVVGHGSVPAANPTPANSRRFRSPATRPIHPLAILIPLSLRSDPRH